MSVRIRLSRGGAKKKPFYRIVAADSRAPRDGSFIERLGTYNPVLPADHAERLCLKEERVRHWLATGAKPSERVARLLGLAGLAAVPTVPTQTKKSLPRAKAQERLRVAEEQARQAAEAAAAEAATE